jgi:predicted metal-dependent hydrolase
MLAHLKTILSNSLSDPEVDIEGERVPVRIHRNQRSKRISMRADAVKREIRITMPHYTPTTIALDFVHKKREWIAARLNSVADAAPIVPGGEIAVAGEAHVIAWQEDWPRAIRCAEGILRVGGPLSSLEARVLRWLKSEARRIYSEEIAYYCARANAPVPRLSLGDPRSRWGSCSSRGTISLSWRLIMAPASVRRSVIAHEVAHIRHMNHSAEFYAWLDMLYEGNRKAADQWLKVHGTALQRVGR